MPSLPLDDAWLVRPFHGVALPTDRLNRPWLGGVGAIVAAARAPVNEDEESHVGNIVVVIGRMSYTAYGG